MSARPRVAAAALAAATVLATSVTAVSVLVPSPAHAATTGTVSTGTATWGISAYVNSAATGRPQPLAASYAAPSTFDATTRLSTWGAGTGRVAADGSADLAFAGTTVNFAPTGGGWLRLSDLEADLDADGNGTVSAVVAFGTSVTGTPGARTYDPDQTPTRGPLRVDVVTLVGNAAADVDVARTTATWTGLDGTWSPAFTGFLAGTASEGSPATSPWSYAATVTNDAAPAPTEQNPAPAPYSPTRTPEPFTFTVATAAPTVSAEITGTSLEEGVTVGVTADGFRGATVPGDQGVYVGIAPSGGLPDVSGQGGIASFAAADFKPTAMIPTGAFTSTLTAPAAKLDPTLTYSVYTWQAHSHSNPTQDTETPIAIDFEALKRATTTTAAGAERKPFGQTSTITAAVDGPGSVTLTGLGAAQTAPVTDGVATFTVPATVPVGVRTATLGYSGGPSHRTSVATRTLLVTKAATRTALTVTRKPVAGARGRTGTARVVVSGPAGVARPAGAVVVRLTKPGGRTRTVAATLADGAVAVVLPRLGLGRWTAVATYAGSGSFVASKQTRRFGVRVG